MGASVQGQLKQGFVSETSKGTLVQSPMKTQLQPVGQGQQPTQIKQIKLPGGQMLQVAGIIAMSVANDDELQMQEGGFVVILHCFSVLNHFHEIIRLLQNKRHYYLPLASV
ncbi:hypothetical protein DPMN_064314 [Dreissena polymorpha]|uniref:Uncharacterized protein n=1 Tax=Dreissena polymorpha TaxID=45954 RepID=A0A9D4CC11_DREPO|nr:hypothetical protein DPMN_064314 [Dreissena polymorpha]